MHTRQITAQLKVVVRPVHRRDPGLRSKDPLDAAEIADGAKCDQQPADATDTGHEGSSNDNGGTQPQPAACDSQETSRGVRWLDREVSSGKVAKEKLLGGEGAPPPLRTDRVLRSYSMAAPRCGLLLPSEAEQSMCQSSCRYAMLRD